MRKVLARFQPPHLLGGDMSGILTEPERVDDGLVVVDRDLLEVNVGGVRHRHNRVAVLIQPLGAEWNGCGVKRRVWGVAAPVKT